MKRLVFIAILLLSQKVFAQYFQTGQDPSSIKWRQINTENFQIIYPDYFEDQAQKLAYKLEVVYRYAGYSLHYAPQKISILLHTQTVQSNGLVAYAPKRSEFYTTPNQSIYPEDWLNQLAVHEFRHVVQIDKLNSELPRLYKLLLGEQGTALVMGLYMPWWFIEGDAVVTETALSKSGRGRLASFLNEHRAQVVEKGVFSYDKAYLGSYNDYVPNHYQLGYYLVAGARIKYGTQLWENVISSVARHPFSFHPFNRALKKQTGLNKDDLYEAIFDSLAVTWQREDGAYRPQKVSVLTPSHSVFTSYQYPHWVNDSLLIAYKTGLNDVPAFVRISDGQENILFRPGNIFDESVSYRGNWIVWSELIPDVRWAHSGRSFIRMFNYTNHHSITLKTANKALAPCLSPDMRHLAVVENDFSNNYYLTIYSVPEGKLVERLATENINYIITPRWLNNQTLVGIILTDKGKRFAIFNLKNKSIQPLFESDLGNIKQPFVDHNSLYFVADYSGKDLGYRYSFEDKNLYRVYEPRFGASWPELIAEDKIIVSDYTSNGFRVIALKIQEQKVEPPLHSSYNLAQAVASQELGIPKLDSAETSNLYAQNYKRAAHLLHFHSWAPLYIDPYTQTFGQGFSVFSQNILGTTETSLGYRYYPENKTGHWYGHFIYKGWYPTFDIEVKKGQSASAYQLITETTLGNRVVRRDTTWQRFKYNDFSLSAEVALPLNFTRGQYRRFIKPSMQYKYVSYGSGKHLPDNFPEGNHQILTYKLFAYQLLRQSTRDVFPNFGLIADVSFQHSPLGQYDSGHLVAGQAAVYLPSLSRNHGLRLYGGFQYNHFGETFRLADEIAFPRGWPSFTTQKLSVLNFDYKFPLITPDMSLLQCIYLKRLTTTLFYDYARFETPLIDSNHSYRLVKGRLSTYGVELIGELHLFKHYAPIKLGIRTSYLNEIQRVETNLLFSIDFNSL